MLHALRQSAHRTGRLLLPLLLLSWLSLVCGHCLALAGEVDGALAHHEPPVAVEHDCCPQAEPCIGGDCEPPADVTAPSASIKLGDYTPVALDVPAPIPSSLFLTGVVPLPLALAPPGPPSPLYLRNCVFLI
jgi:hypothetical protein